MSLAIWKISLFAKRIGSLQWRSPFTNYLLFFQTACYFSGLLLHMDLQHLGLLRTTIII